jgi:hypothetical protein
MATIAPLWKKSSQVSEMVSNWMRYVGTIRTYKSAGFDVKNSLSQLLARAPTIRARWKEREAQSKANQQPPPQRPAGGGSGNPYNAPVTPIATGSVQGYFPQPTTTPGFRR